jgi:hypothetical protein
MSATPVQAPYQPPATGRLTQRQGSPKPRTLWSRIRSLRWTEFRLLLIPSVLSIVGMLIVILVPTGAVHWEWKDLWMSFLFIGLLYGIHVWLNATRPNADQILLPVVATIMVLGLVMVQRLEPALVTRSLDFAGIAQKQVVWITLGMLAM